MHNLSGIYIKEDKSTVIEDKSFYTFKMIYPQKEREYYVEDKDEFKAWVTNLSRAVGFFDLNMKYEIGPKLGNGKFGLVKLATNKKTGEKYAAKFMSKKEMSNVDLELVRTEIEILKVCQHPNIIRIFDIFENMDSYYICKFLIIFIQSWSSAMVAIFSLAWKSPSLRFLKKQQLTIFIKYCLLCVIYMNTASLTGI